MSSSLSYYCGYRNRALGKNILRVILFFSRNGFTCHCRWVVYVNIILYVFVASNVVICRVCFVNINCISRSAGIWRSIHFVGCRCSCAWFSGINVEVGQCPRFTRIPNRALLFRNVSQNSWDFAFSARVFLPWIPLRILSFCCKARLFALWGISRRLKKNRRHYRSCRHES